MLQTVFLRGALPAMSKKRAPALRRRAVHVSATANAFNRTAQQGFNPNNSALARQGGQQLSFRPRTRARQAPPPQELPDEPEQTEQNEEVERRVVNDNEEYTEEATSAYSGHQQPQEGRPRQQKGSPSPLLAIYRPNRDSAKGSAAQFGYSSQKRSVYLSMAKQAGDKTAPGSSDKQFGWDNKIVFKLDVPGSFFLFSSRGGGTSDLMVFFPRTDMSKLLNALDGRVPALDILHMSEGSTQQVRSRFQA